MKHPHRRAAYIVVVALAITLAACSSQDSADNEAPQLIPTIQGPIELGSEITDVGLASSPHLWVEEDPRSDDQGSVSIEITPVNLNDPGLTLDFQVTMNTHSVDLSMELADLATLETDTGHIVNATLWDAPRSGHHVSGILSFPAGVDETQILDGATKMEIVLVDLDAPERVFIWER